MHGASLSSAAIKYTDPELVACAVRSYATHIRANHLHVRRIIWFGSWIRGTYSPGSDVDICIVVSRSDKPRRDRVPDYLPRSFPVGMDLFVYTSAEWRTLESDHPEWFREINAGRDV